MSVSLFIHNIISVLEAVLPKIGKEVLTGFTGFIIYYLFAGLFTNNFTSKNL